MSGIETLGTLLVVNADDFGLSGGVSRGIAEAHDAGIVTSTSLMVLQPAAEAAADLAADRPQLSIGLHVDLTDEGGPPRIDLTDAHAATAAIHDQLDRFEQLIGRPPSHLDAHHNVHRFPDLAPAFVAAAVALDVPLREQGSVRYFPDFYGQWDDETHPEQISPEHLRHMLLHDIGPGVTELSCHPGRFDPALDSAYHREREIELTTLLDPDLPTFLNSTVIELVDYPTATARLRSAGLAVAPEPT